MPFTELLNNYVYFLFSFQFLVMSREEANRLSSLRRDELRKNRELESNRALRIKNMLKVNIVDIRCFFVFDLDFERQN